MKHTRGKLDETLAVMYSSQNEATLRSYLFYAHIVGQCSIKITPDLSAPAGVLFNVDHYELHIRLESGMCDNILVKGFDDYTLQERLAILKHEALHILNDHVHRIEDRKLKPWNLATDCAINQFIDVEHLPQGGILPDFLDKILMKKVQRLETSEYYYDLLKQHSNETGETDESDESSETYYGHPLWDKSNGEKEIQADITKKMIETASNETLNSIGEIPEKCTDWIKLHSTKSQYNWKSILRGIVGNKRVGTRHTIMRRDRRFPKRADLRGKTKERVFNLLVVCDVSGSMSDDAILSTLAEVRHICDITKTSVDLIQIDTTAHEPEKLSKTTTLIQRKGSGGTELSPALLCAKEYKIDYQAIVVLTDGWVCHEDIEEFKNTNKRVIWLIAKDGKIYKEMNTGKMIALKLKNYK